MQDACDVTDIQSLGHVVAERGGRFVVQPREDSFDVILVCPDPSIVLWQTNIRRVYPVDRKRGQRMHW